MDRNRLILFIAISAAITFGFQLLMPGRPHVPAPVTQAALTQPNPGSSPMSKVVTPPGHQPVPVAPPKDAPRLHIDAPRVAGSISLVGARLDDLELKDYHETVKKSSPLVRILEPAGDPSPSYVQFGWAASTGVKVPDDSTLWTSSGGDLTADHPVTLSWDNGAGLTFSIALSVDKNYMFEARQSVKNSGKDAVDLWPWQRVRRDYAPPAASYSVLFEGLLGVADARTHQMGWAAARSAADKNGGTAYDKDLTGGWAGFTDKYWLTAVIPAQAAAVKSLWFYNHDDGTDHYQVSYQTQAPQHVAPGANADFDSRAFVGAKEVHLLDRYEHRDHIPLLSYAVDWGMFYFLTRPFFYAIDWIYSVTGNFGIAILIFTVLVKTAFFPLAVKSYRSMGKMRLLAPKITEVRAKHKDDPAAQQKAMMEVYAAEGISPMAQAGGCLPMLIQIPVFFSLYKVILVTIEMRHAPFFGWIQDLSAVDPTNVFNLFGLLPFNPALISPTLHLGIWPCILGLTMYFQQKLNPPPPDPVQARMFQFMPLIFMFMLGRFPAGLVIYYAWNNTLTIVQQWYIQRGTKLGKAAA
jgi:YidC/Oxa1 family membrane protein insertase